jgi:hypothetical protein
LYECGREPEFGVGVEDGLEGCVEFWVGGEFAVEGE